jgi:transketolase
VDGHDAGELAGAMSWAMRNRKPTLIACRTIIGLGAPTKAGTAGSHGAPLGAAEAAAAKQALGWNAAPFEVPADIKALWENAGRRGAGARRSWLKRIAKHPQRAEFERAMAGRLPEAWNEALSALRAQIAADKPKLATRVSSQKALEALVPSVPEMVGGSADLTGSNNTNVKGVPAIAPGNFSGRFVHWGVREHGMAAAMNGMALHGGIIPYSGTFLVFSDYLRPAVRLAALMRQRVIHVLTHDSIGLGEDARRISRWNISLPSAPCRMCMCSAQRMRWKLRNAGNWPCAALMGLHCLRFRAKTCPRCAPIRPRIALPAAAMCWRKPMARAARR